MDFTAPGALGPSPFAKSLPTPADSWQSIGPEHAVTPTYPNFLPITSDATASPLTSSAVDSHAKHSARPRAVETPLPTSGLSTCASLARSALLGSLLRTSLELALEELTGCAVISKRRTTPQFRSILILRYRRDSVKGAGSSGWPTPTATANHDAPSMRKWPAYARYQGAVGRTYPPLWEWMMDFPIGWTALDASETP
jgi:hypothetical protein